MQASFDFTLIQFYFIKEARVCMHAQFFFSIFFSFSCAEPSGNLLCAEKKGRKRGAYLLYISRTSKLDLSMHAWDWGGGVPLHTCGMTDNSQLTQNTPPSLQTV